MAVKPIKIEIIASTKGAEKSFDQLKESQKELDRATQDYAKTLLELDRAEKSGLATQTRVNKLAGEAATKYKRAATQAAALAGATVKTERANKGLISSMTRLGSVSGSTRGKIQNVGFQIQDIVVQLQGGTALTTTLAQQLPQLAGAFGAVGAVIGTGLALGIPALGVAFSALIGETVTLEDVLDDLDQAISDVDKNMDILTLSAEELSRRYGESAQTVRRFAVAQAELIAEQAAVRLADQIDVLAESAEQYARGAGFATQRRLEKIQDELGASEQAARELQTQFNRLARQDDFKVQQDALQNILNLMNEYGLELNKLPEDIQEGVRQMIELAEATARAETAMANLRAEAANVNIGDVGFLSQFTGEELLPPSGRTGYTEPPDLGGRRGGGGPRTNVALESLIDSLQTERETIEEWRTESFDLLNEANAKELEILGGHNEAKLRLEAEYQKRISAIKQAGNQNDLQSVLKGGAEILGALGRNNQKALKISQAFAAAEALVSTYKGAAKEIEKGTFGFATAAAVIAKGLAFVSAIKSIGASPSGGTSGGGTAGAAAGAGGGTEAQQPSTFFTVNLTGEGAFGRDQVRTMISAINEEVENGAIIKGIAVNG